MMEDDGHQLNNMDRNDDSENADSSNDSDDADESIPDSVGDDIGGQNPDDSGLGEGEGDSYSEESDEEPAWGDHVSSRNAFVYAASSDSEDGSEDGAAEVGRAAEGRQRRSAFSRASRSIVQFLRSH